MGLKASGFLHVYKLPRKSTSYCNSVDHIEEMERNVDFPNAIGLTFTIIALSVKHLMFNSK